MLEVHGLKGAWFDCRPSGKATSINPAGVPTGLAGAVLGFPYRQGTMTIVLGVDTGMDTRAFTEKDGP